MVLLAPLAQRQPHLVRAAPGPALRHLVPVARDLPRQVLRRAALRLRVPVAAVVAVERPCRSLRMARPGAMPTQN
jgi:hypothetical protein